MAGAGATDPFVPVAEVICTICLEDIGNSRSKAIARLKCGHIFHLCCIGCEFNTRGMMRCPNCRVTEVGEWSCDSAFENARAARFNIRNAHHQGQNPTVGAMWEDSVPNVRGRTRNRQNPPILGIPQRTRSAPLHPIGSLPTAVRNSGTNPSFPFATPPPSVSISVGIAIDPFPQAPHEDPDPISFALPMDPRQIPGFPHSQHVEQTHPISFATPLDDTNFRNFVHRLGAFSQAQSSTSSINDVSPSGFRTPANGRSYANHLDSHEVVASAQTSVDVSRPIDRVDNESYISGLEASRSGTVDSSSTDSA